MVRHILLNDLFAFLRLMPQNRTADTDPFHAAFHNYRLGIHIKKLILQGRTAGIHNQNFHQRNSFNLLFAHRLQRRNGDNRNDIFRLAPS